jgi:hypothetical protein
MPPIKVRVDQDPNIAGRLKSLECGTGDPWRTFKAIAARGSSTTIKIG